VLSRRWLVASVIVLATAVTMIELGLWQLRRLDQVRADNAIVRSQLAMPVEPLSEAFAPGARPAYRRVVVDGRYDATEQVRVDNRSDDDGSPGRHLLTPLVISDGTALIVDRGWIPLDANPADAAPPAGEVRAVGVLFPSEKKVAFSASIPPEGRVTAVPRIDVARLSKQLPYAALRLYLRLEQQDPAQAAALPKPPGLPSLDDGPHLSYAVQWFLFTTVELAVFGALVRREAARRRRKAAE